MNDVELSGIADARADCPYLTVPLDLLFAGAFVLRNETDAKNLDRTLIGKHCPPYNRQQTAAVLTGTVESRQNDRLEKIGSETLTD